MISFFHRPPLSLPPHLVYIFESSKSHRCCALLSLRSALHTKHNMADSSRSETPETSGHIDKSAADATGDGHDRVSHKLAISNHNPKAPNVTIDLGGLLSHGEPAGNSSAKSAEPEAVESAEEGTENPDRPKGIRFVIVYSCILLGDFFVGYVSRFCPPATLSCADQIRSSGH